MDITRSVDGRFEGTIRSEAHEAVPLSGMLELLGALEDVLQARPSNGPPGTGRLTPLGL